MAAAKKTTARPPAKKATTAKKTTTKKAAEAGATSSAATPRGKKAVGAGASAPTAPGTLQHVAPGELLLERNIRKPKLDPEFVQSIGELGVLQPITAVRNGEGRLVVRYGERRALAAIQVDLKTVPVYVAGEDDQADAAEVDRIIRQRDENTHREGLTSIDDLHVVEQLVAFGIPAEEISSRARIPKDRVAAAVAVSGSKLAGAAAAKYEALTLDQAAALAEFEGDTATAQALIATAVERPDQFNHLLQRQRDDRDEKRLMAEAAEALEEKGIDVIAPPNYSDRTKRIAELVDVETGKDVTDAAHAKCPGNVAFINIRWIGSERKLTAVTVFCCNDPAKHGHRDRYSTGGGGGARPKAADMSDAEREKAKKARRLVIDNNKAWDSALKVRREWLAAFATHKTPPAGAEAFIAAVLVENPSSLTDGGKLSAAWTGVERFKSDAITKATPKRALHIALMRILAAYEAQFGSQFGRNIWRRNNTNTDEGRYLRFLESAGYPLSDVEKFAVSSKTAS